MNKLKHGQDVNTDRLVKELRRVVQAADSGVIKEYYHSEHIESDDVVTESIAVEFIPTEQQ